MLNQMKGIKMMGLTDFILQMLQDLRVKELKVSAKFRWLLVHFNALGESPHDCVTSLTVQL
jgi:ATP-binding cassette, subfamily C (CFTR/MRP), member 1